MLSYDDASYILSCINDLVKKDDESTIIKDGMSLTMPYCVDDFSTNQTYSLLLRLLH